MIATLQNENGDSVVYELDEFIYVPPFYIIRKGLLFAVQPGWTDVNGLEPLRATYKQTYAIDVTGLASTIIKKQEGAA